MVNPMKNRHSFTDPTEVLQCDAHEIRQKNGLRQEALADFGSFYQVQSWVRQRFTFRF